MSIAVVKGFLAALLYSYVKDSSITWMLIVLIQFLVGLFIELPLLGFGTRKVDAECFNIKDATVIGRASNIGQGYFKFYIPRLKVPTYRYIVDGKLYVSTPDLMSNLPGYNPVAGPCTIRVKKNKPWKMISPLRHSVASEFSDNDYENDYDEYWNDDWMLDIRDTSSEDSTVDFSNYESLYPSPADSL